MTYRKRVERRLEQKEKRFETEQLLKEKRSEEYEVLEEVFLQISSSALRGHCGMRMGSAGLERIW